MTTQRVTSAQANDILSQVKYRFRVYSRATGSTPKLVRNYEPYWGGGSIPYAILWEDGPTEWVCQALWGEPDPELLADDIRLTVPPLVPPLGTWLEAGTSFILCIFPDSAL